MRLGFVGAGRIGRPMVRRLVADRHQVRVLVRSEQARGAPAADGAVVVSEPGEVTQGAEVVLVCVYSDDQVRQVCLGTGDGATDGGLLGSMAAGSLLVVHTTGSPQTIAALVERAGPRGIQVVDAPLSGGPHDVAAGRVTLLLGGSDDAVDTVRPVLRAYGNPVLHLGPSGSGQAAKLINNALFAANLGLLAHALELGAGLRLDQSALLDALQHGSSASRALDLIASRGSVAEFAGSVGEFLVKDLAVVRSVVADLGADLGPLAPAHRELIALTELTAQLQSSTVPVSS
jgi:3-hydroxyisobutyrate dehydrogenase-like beta-hydroxyacid dehydrogenase